MVDRPIIFSAPMVRALLDGRKTQTRRITKRQDGIHVDGRGGWLYPGLLPYAPGDRLWVREAFAINEAIRMPRRIDNVMYRADLPDEAPPMTNPISSARLIWNTSPKRWKPSIHMPRWASRLTLTVTDVRVQRLQDISGEDCISEGVECQTCAASWSVGLSACNQRGCFEIRQNFHTLWNSLHGPDAWDANPWLAAISFTVQRGNIDS